LLSHTHTHVFAVSGNFELLSFCGAFIDNQWCWFDVSGRLSALSADKVHSCSLAVDFLGC